MSVNKNHRKANLVAESQQVSKFLVINNDYNSVILKILGRDLSGGKFVFYCRSRIDFLRQIFGRSAKEID